MKLEPPRMEQGRTLLIAGIGARYACETAAGIPAQWQGFLPWFGNVPGQVGAIAFGVNCNGDDQGNFDYLCGVEVADFSRVPAELARLRMAEHGYAVFTHRGHVSAIRGT